MTPWELPLAIPYWIGFIVFWRTFTGHFAWTIHRSATYNKTVRPPIENWIGAACISLPLAIVWFITLIFLVPWPWTRGAEQEEEIKLRGLNYAELEQSNRQAEKAIGIVSQDIQDADAAFDPHREGGEYG